MDSKSKLYPTVSNPLLLRSELSLPREVGIIGAGTIGPDIGYYMKSALPGITLHLVDVADGPLRSARERLEGYARKAVDKRKMNPEQADAVLQNLFFTQDYDRIAGCDLVMEAATENIPLKQTIFRMIEERVGPETILTSNTSSIPADRIFNRLERPERATVTHFFAPAWRSLAVEVVRWEKVDPEVVDHLFWFFAATGKAPIITDNAICFVLDRIFDNWCNESVYLLEHATASQIDKVAESFVFAGPFFVINMANGNPIILETNGLQMEEGEHYRPAPILHSVDRWNTHRPGAPVEVPADLQGLIRDRLLGILFSQTFDIIDRGIGIPEDVNFGCQIALAFRKGPLDLMRELGENEVQRITSRFLSERPGFPAARASFSSYQDFRRFVLVDEIDGVKVVTIRRPQALNALTTEITDEILAVLEAHDEDPSVKGFVITGYGSVAFSAGADIGRFPEVLGDFDALYAYTREWARPQRYLDRIRKPTVAAVNGMALGGGLELAIRCHAIVAVKHAKLQFPEITLGILPGVGGAVVPYRKWPRGASLFNDMLTLGKPVSAGEAAGTGMVSRLVEDLGSLIPAAVEEVDRLAGKLPALADGRVDPGEIRVPDPPMAGDLPLSRESVAITVQTIEDGCAAPSFEEALEIGYRGFARTACGDAAREGISAFLEKRRPHFNR